MLILRVSPMFALMAGKGHWPLMPTKARVYPSGAALTHPTFQLYVLRSGVALEVAVALALVVAVVLIVEHAVNTDVPDRADVTSVVELEDEELTAVLEGKELTVELEDEEVTVELRNEELNVELEDEEVTLELVDTWLVELEDDTVLDVVEDTTLAEELDVVKGPVFWYRSSLLPAPQYSSGFPGQRKLQSVVGAGPPPGLIVFPQ